MAKKKWKKQKAGSQGKRKSAKRRKGPSGGGNTSSLGGGGGLLSGIRGGMKEVAGTSDAKAPPTMFAKVVNWGLWILAAVLAYAFVTSMQ